jgi:hypothetical protein
MDRPFSFALGGRMLLIRPNMLFAIACLAGVLAGTPARAAPPAEQVHEADTHTHHTHEDDPSLHGGHQREVVVEAPTDGPERPVTAVSDTQIEMGKLAEVPRSNPEDLLTFSPGVVLTNAGGEGHPSTIYVRGFDAGEGEDMEMSVEGIPMNEVANPHNHGYADTGFIIPELITHVRVTQGSFDPAQGDFATAGSAGYSIGMRERGVHMHGGYGRFNQWRSAALWGPRGQESGTFLAVDGKGGEGFGTNRAHRSTRLMGGYAHTFRRHTHLRLMGAAHLGEWQQAGVLRLDDFEAGRMPCASDADAQFFCTYDENQGGEVSRYLVGARLFRDEGRQRYSHGLFASGRFMTVRENFTGFTEDLGNPGGPRGDGVAQHYRMLTVGARGFYGMRLPWRDNSQTLDVGYHLRYDHGRSRLQRLAISDGSPYATLFDHELDLFNPAIYLRGGFVPARWFELRAGVRLDLWVQSVQRNALPTPDSAQQVQGHAFAPQPRVSMTFLPLDWLNVIASYGMGSRSADANGLAADGSTSISRTHGAETGLRFLWDDLGTWADLDWRVMAFYTNVSADQAFDEAVGRNVATGASHHYGLMSSLGLDVRGWLELQASGTWAEAHLSEPDAGPFDWGAGERVPGVPRLTLRGDATLWHGFTVGSEHFTWHLSAGAGHVGRRPLPFETLGTAFTLVDAGAGMRWRWIELGIQVENLLDTRYHEAELYYPSNFGDPVEEPSQMPMLHFAAGAPLSVMGTLSLHFDPGEVEHFRKDRAQRRAGESR